MNAFPLEEWNVGFEFGAGRIALNFTLSSDPSVAEQQCGWALFYRESLDRTLQKAPIDCCSI
jgi:hypothetical protein